MTGPFPQIVFSGGGLRCFWHGGFMEVVRDALGLSPERIVGVSGGALSAASFVAGRERALLDRMRAAFADETSNVSLGDALSSEDGRTPHQRVYDEVVSDVLDAEAQGRVAEGTAFQIMLAHPPTGRLPGLAGTFMALAYEAELHLVGSPHFSWAERLGLRTSRVDARAAAAEGTLHKLVVAAATIPPVFRTPEWDGKPVIDGGMADQAPMPEPDRGATLVLLTRRYRRLPSGKDRLYVAPSEEAPVGKIDFTDPDLLTRTWALGRRDGEAFLASRKTDKED